MVIVGLLRGVYDLISVGEVTWWWLMITSGSSFCNRAGLSRKLGYFASCWCVTWRGWKMEDRWTSVRRAYCSQRGRFSTRTLYCVAFQSLGIGGRGRLASNGLLKQDGQRVFYNQVYLYRWGKRMGRPLSQGEEWWWWSSRSSVGVVVQSRVLVNPTTSTM